MLKPIYQLRSDTKSEIVINLYKEEIYNLSTQKLQANLPMTQ